MLQEKKIKAEYHKKKTQLHPEQHMHPKSKEWSYPDYTEKVKKVVPTKTEFGKVFTMTAIAINDQMGVKTVYNLALSDFFAVKAENFPDWPGLPEIKISPTTGVLSGDLNIAWYAQVPNQFVISPEDKLEEDLWNS